MNPRTKIEKDVDRFCRLMLVAKQYGVCSEEVGAYMSEYESEVIDLLTVLRHYKALTITKEDLNA
jgi:hypothetical protein